MTEKPSQKKLRAGEKAQAPVGYYDPATEALQQSLMASAGHDPSSLTPTTPNQSQHTRTTMDPGVSVPMKPPLDRPYALAKPTDMANLTPMLMLDRAISQGASVEVLEKLMGLQERYEQNQGRKAFDNAMAAAKAVMPVIVKNQTVSYGTGKPSYVHEDLATIARTIDPILAEHGLSYRFRTTSGTSATMPDHSHTATSHQSITVTCIVSHREGHSEENSLTSQPDDTGGKNAIQALGSAVTYLQRYSLKAALGLSASKDDDGRGGDQDRLVSDKQRDELIELADKFGVDKGAFCKFYEVPSLADIPANDFAKAKSAMLAKGAANA